MLIELAEMLRGLDLPTRAVIRHGFVYGVGLAEDGILTLPLLIGDFGSEDRKTYRKL